jgi:hypothetical protein
MLKKMLYAASCVAVFGGASGMNTQESFVENPIPLIVRAISPNFLDDINYNALCNTFERRLSEFEKECLNGMKLPGFPEYLNTEWEKKLKLLRDTAQALKSKGSVEDVYNELITVTNDGFYSDSKVAIFGTENSETFDKILDDFWQHLWQSRELISYFHLSSLKEVVPSKIPMICEALDRSVSTIRHLSDSEELKFDAEKIESVISKTLTAYKYYSPQDENKNETKKDIKEIFTGPQFKNVPTLEMLMQKCINQLLLAKARSVLSHRRYAD